MSDKAYAAVIITGILAVVGTIASIALVDIETVQGSEIGVKETWGGVDPNPVPPSTGIYGPTTTIYRYDMTSKVFVMNNVPQSSGEDGVGRENDAYLVQSRDQQDMHISLNVRWRFDPSKILAIHNNYHSHVKSKSGNVIEERLIRPTVMLSVKNHATKMNAIEAYSGDGLVRLQSEIESSLASATSELRNQGVIVENFVIERIDLDSKYTDEIKARQIAQQKELRSREEIKAAQAEALKAEAEAQADLKRQVVAAERDKEVARLRAEQAAAANITAAQAAAQEVEIAAQASKQKTILAAEAAAQEVEIAAQADLNAAQARAASIKALGEADAKKNELLLASYAGPGADNFVMIQVSQNMAEAFKNIQGYLPSDMNITMLSNNFLESVRSFVNPNGVVIPKNSTTIITNK